MPKYTAKLYIERMESSEQGGSYQVDDIDIFTLPRPYREFTFLIKNPAFFKDNPIGTTKAFSPEYRDFIISNTNAVTPDFFEDYFHHYLAIKQGLSTAVGNLRVDAKDRFIDPVLPRKKTKNPKIIFRRYLLYAKEPVQLPYSSFLSTYPKENCLIEFVLDKLTRFPQKKSSMVSEKSIRKFFEDDTSISRLIELAEKYQLRITLYDIFGKYIVHNDPNTDVSLQRHGLYAMIYDNHIYPYKETRLLKNVSFHPDQEHGLDNFEITSSADMSDIEKEVVRTMYKQLRHTGFNFSYRAEENLFIRPLNKYFSKESHEDAICFDMKGAFDTSLRMFPDNKIGIFSTQDEIKSYNNEDIINEAYYFISKEKHEDLRSSTRTYAKALHSIFLGYEIKHLIKKDHIEKFDITHVKLPSRTRTAKSVSDIIDKAYEENKELITEYDKTSTKSFNVLYNGVLGKRFTSPTTVFMTTDNEDDVDLLEEQHDDANIHTTPNYTGIRKTRREMAYLEINNRNIYDYVIAMTNLRLMKFADAILRDIKEAQLIKMKVDEVVFINVPKHLQIPDAFHVKGVTWRPFDDFQEFQDPQEMINNTIEEVSKASDNCTIYVGHPGSGKTYKMKHDHEQDFDVSATMTNVCARNIDTERVKADTLFKTLKVYDYTKFNEVLKSLKGKSLWIDEFSMVNSDYWNLIYILTKNCLKSLYLTGDPKQTKPINDELRYNSLFFKELFKNKIVLSEEYRNEESIIDVRMTVELGDEDVIIDTLKQYKKKRHIHEIMTHLCGTHKLKGCINAMMLDKHNLIFDPINKKISDGLVLLGRISKKARAIYKGMRYTVLSSNDKEISLTNGVTISYSDLRLFNLGYAITIHSAQGLTIEEDFAIHQIGRIIRWDIDILYTAITRGRTMDQIYPYFKEPVECSMYQPWENPLSLTRDDEKEADD